jgi:predicted DNA-binding protein (UPF0251 family)
MEYPKFVSLFNSLGMNFNTFAKLAKVDRITLKRIYEGKSRILHHLTAAKIVAASGGKLKLSDFGFVD